VQLVALESGEIAGTALYFPPGTSFGDDTERAAMSPNCPEVRLLAVAPEGRGSGIGRALMETCVERAKSDGAPGLVLHTMAMMRVARFLYDSMGFARAPELDFEPAQNWYVEGFRLDF
jgi:GNAT superfamily N-acetyltransferase